MPESDARDEGTARVARPPVTSGRELRISIAQTRPDAKAEVAADLKPVNDWTPATLPALDTVAKWIAESILAPIDQLKDQWSGNDAGLAGLLAQSGEELDSANQVLHGLLVKDSVGFVVHETVDDPGSRWLLEGIAEHMRLSHNNLIDKTVQWLRLTSVTISLIAGAGVPMPALLGLITDALKEALASEIAEALVGRPSIVPRTADVRDEDDLDAQPPSITAGGPTGLPATSTVRSGQRHGMSGKVG